MDTSTVLTRAKIDINPDGVTISFEGIDTDLAKLLANAGTFNSGEAIYHSISTSDVQLKSSKALSFVNRPPALTTTDTTLGSDAVITFTANATWEGSIKEIFVDGALLPTADYTVGSGSITISSTVFPAIGDYKIMVNALDYADAEVTQTIV